MHRSNARGWRTPLAALLCGAIVLNISLGVRHGTGLFLKSVTLELGVSREA